MQSQTKTSKTDLLGFVQLQVGSLTVQLPIKAAEPRSAELPLASFHVDGSVCTILVHGDKSSKAVESAMQGAMEEAVKHLSKKLLN